MSTPEEIILVVWFFVLGGVIGSFLNVVVYRVPNRLSLIEPPSHCPKCKRRIRWRDNVPIIGWLVLRGKCRDCGQRISARYPLVELTTSLMFGILFIVELALGGDNLPVRDNGIIVVRNSTAELYLTGALMEFDRHRPPPRMYVWTILVGLIFPLQWAVLRPMKAWPGEPTFMAGGIEGLFGLAAGGILGYVAYRLQGSRPPGGTPLGLVCVGVFLGWQAVLPVGIMATILGAAAAAMIPRKRHDRLVPTSAWLWILAFFWILCWSPLVRLMNLP